MNKKEKYSPSSFKKLRTSPAFTLIEVLLAMAILSVIVTVVYSVFSSTGSSVEHAEAVRDGTDLARTLLARLSTDIANTYVRNNMPETFLYGRKDEDEEKKTRFDAVFLTTRTNWRRPGTKETDLWEVGYYFEDKPNNVRAFMRTEKRELSKDVPRLEGGVKYELTDKVAGLRLRYASASGAWVDEWDTSKGSGIPKAVEIILTLSDGRIYTTQTDVRNP